ncbi:PQQ-binding-like beta-propeller repeat protein [Mycobacterium sp. 852013-50091_SCH5140682]|uniref:outer membrane protein assembly factor BamB family protein n=1 Tax=Mycobacterium sp. 852013-50091_SCH5140682 TaxID=1834109 RepID=UPI0012E99EA8|nr:PQQ-binding-like beta-propeller repeat protein [Mycobacterium sp. 852013-50091_SCH5140682]
MNQWGSSPWGDNDGQPGASGWSESPFDAPEVRQEAPPVFGAAPGLPMYPQTQGWGQAPGYGYPQFTPQPPDGPRRRGKVIGIVVSAVVVVLALVIGSVVVWKFSSGGSGSDTDTTAGKAEVASESPRPPAEVKLPSLSAAPTTLWSYPPSGDSSSYLTVLGGDTKTVIIKLGDSIIGLDAAGGSQLWQQPWPKSNGDYVNCVVGTSGDTAMCVGDNMAAIIDMKTGTTKNTVSGHQGSSGYSGSGLLAYADNTVGVTVFDDSGQQLWTKPMTGVVQPFLDQGIIAAKAPTNTKFYDAKTGDDLFSIGIVDDLIATSRGIAVSVRGSSVDVQPDRYPKQRIDFYSFTGKKAWSIPEDAHYRLPHTAILTSYTLPQSVENSTSGVASPIVYSEDKGEIAGVDDATGEIRWSQQVPLVPHTLPSLSGIGDLCIVAIPTAEPSAEPGAGAPRVRVRKCTDATGALVAPSQGSSSPGLVAVNGDQTVIGGPGSDSTTAYDAATGQQLWQLGRDAGSFTLVGDALYSASFGRVSRVS